VTVDFFTFSTESKLNNAMHRRTKLPRRNISISEIIYSPLLLHCLHWRISRHAILKIIYLVAASAQCIRKAGFIAGWEFGVRLITQDSDPYVCRDKTKSEYSLLIFIHSAQDVQLMHVLQKQLYCRISGKGVRQIRNPNGRYASKLHCGKTEGCPTPSEDSLTGVTWASLTGVTWASLTGVTWASLTGVTWASLARA
jgi:hypothetical protein